MTVPDDARTLEADRAVWVAEERRRRRRRRLRRLVLTRRWERFGFSGPILTLCLLLTAGVGSLAVVLVPRPRTPPPAAAPLAAVPRVAVPAADAPAPPEPAPVLERGGDILGRRLPAAVLTADLGTVTTDDVRPAVLLLAPADCGCAPAVRTLYVQAREFRLSTWLVAPGGRDAASTAAARRGLDALDAQAAAGGARWALDPDDVLARGTRARGLTVVLVRPDGTVAVVLRDVAPDGGGLPAMEIALAALAPRR